MSMVADEPRVAEEPRTADRPALLRSVGRGATGRCPACGAGRLFGRFLKVVPDCDSCGQHLGHHRADDFPPYIVMFITGHLVGFGIYTAEMRFEDVPLALHAVLWPALAIGLSLALLQPVKGAVVGLQYALGMHGFGAPGLVEDAGGRGAWGTPESLVRGRASGTEMAQPPPAGRRHLDGGRPLG